MLELAVAAFLVLHGLVHLLYLGQGRGLFELQPGMTWPADSWLVSGRLGGDAINTLASLACAIAAAGFVAGGAGYLANQVWWRPVVIGAAGLSALVVAVFWDGSGKRLPDQGAVGLLIDLAIVAAVALA